MQSNVCSKERKLLEFPTAEARPEEWLGPLFLVGEREHRLYPLDPDNIEYIESNGNYVAIRVANQTYISRDSLTRLAGELARHGFIRIERSFIVNIRAVLYVSRAKRGTFEFVLASGARLRSSVTYRATIIRALPLGSFSTRRAAR
ncbi:MAG: LytTR family DNA-binding domain-containing protein [Steroidobacteraceae bacterium]